MNTAATPEPDLFAGGTPAPSATSDNAATPPAGGTVGGDGTPVPWWERAVPGKWKSEDEAIKGYAESSKEARRLAEEAKTAAEKLAEVEGRWKGVEGIVGAPVDSEGKPIPYAFELPEGAELLPELREAFEADLRELNLSPAAGQRLLNRYLEVEQGVELGRREVEKDMVVQTLGAGDEAVALTAVNASLAWARGMLGDAPEAEDLLTGPGGVSSYGKALVALDRLRAAFEGGTMGASSGGTSAFGESQYRTLLEKQVRGQLTQQEQAALVAYLNARNPDTSA